MLKCFSTQEKKNDCVGFCACRPSKAAAQICTAQTACYL